MDALVAYLQILGRLTDAAHKTVATAGGEMTPWTRHDDSRLVRQDLRPVLPDRAVG